MSKRISARKTTPRLRLTRDLNNTRSTTTSPPTGYLTCLSNNPPCLLAHFHVTYFNRRILKSINSGSEKAKKGYHDANDSPNQIIHVTDFMKWSYLLPAPHTKCGALTKTTIQNTNLIPAPNYNAVVIGSFVTLLRISCDFIQRVLLSPYHFWRPRYSKQWVAQTKIA